LINWPGPISVVPGSKVYSKKKLKKSKKLVSKLYTKNPLDRMKTISRINLLKFIKQLETKINKLNDPSNSKSGW
jgi:hypothetical protein